MTIRKLALASCALVGLASTAGAQQLDLGGQPCAGVLDGFKQCIRKEDATQTADHPYRHWTKTVPGDGFKKAAHHFIFVALPGGDSSEPHTEAKTGEGLIVLDADADYAFVKRIPIQNLPVTISPEDVSAMMASPATNMLYLSTRGHLIAMDLASEKIVWSKAYEPGTCCERGQVTPDGLTLEVGSNLKDFHRVIDARTGEVKGIIQTPLSMFNHNMGMSADGKTVFDAPNGVTMTVADMATMKATKTITFSDHVRVFVVNHDASRVYANLNNLLGFEIADVKTGKVIKRVEAPGQLWKAKWADPNQVFYGHGAPQHGIAFTPDESEIWVPSAIDNQTLVYDNLGNDDFVLNKEKSFKTQWTSDWITMGLDGKIAMMSSGDIVDVQSHRIIAQMKDERGNLLHSEKFLEMTFNPQGHLLRVENQFAEGDPAAYAARMAREKKEARN